MSGPQLACLAIVAGPMFVGALWALGNSVAVGTLPAPSLARFARQCVGLPLLVAVWIIGFLAELADRAVVATHTSARNAVPRLVTWMDV
jgi:hypothetical protein